MAKKKPAPVKPPPFRDRIVDLRRVRAADLLPADFNWRTHGDAQRAAVTGSLHELGITDPLNAYQLPDGRLKLWDGHLRQDIFEGCGPDTLVPVIVTNLDETEAKKANLTHDPIAALATADADKLEALLADVTTDDEALQALIGDLAVSAEQVEDGEKVASERAADEMLLLPYEHYDYVIILSSDLREWNLLSEIFDLKPVKTRLSKSKIGIGRAVWAKKALEKMREWYRDHGTEPGEAELLADDLPTPSVG